MRCRPPYHKEQYSDAMKRFKCSHLSLSPCNQCITYISSFHLQGNVREQHFWETRRHEGHTVPGLSGSRASTVGAACTNSTLYGLIQRQNLRLPTITPTATAADLGPGTSSKEQCPTKSNMEMFCSIPPKLAKPGNSYWSWRKAGESAIS